jgi:hypothetical protein
MAGSHDSPPYSKAESFLKIANISANAKPKSQGFKLVYQGSWGLFSGKKEAKTLVTLSLYYFGKFALALFIKNK